MVEDRAVVAEKKRSTCGGKSVDHGFGQCGKPRDPHQSECRDDAEAVAGSMINSRNVYVTRFCYCTIQGEKIASYITPYNPSVYPQELSDSPDQLPHQWHCHQPLRDGRTKRIDIGIMKAKQSPHDKQ